ncbi:hypothetical protein AJ80_03867 [Polytolypa hystricis UAMH7299]|uniref:Uncharacterized protein n=1 Tax=Polytolypa hystricis (strain UAMH7299) TaxID=1447883 RepID=A0A2B7YF75_POLH7|nr:hypothetical protein AJ80_03867 [Polytolypa hystricis UAMH7299]
MLSLLRDQILPLVTPLLLKCAESSTALIKIDKWDDVAIPRNSLLLPLLDIEKDLRSLLYSVLQRETTSLNPSQIIERTCSSLILQGCTRSVSVLDQKLKLYASNKLVSWNDVLKLLGKYRLHVESLAALISNTSTIHDYEYFLQQIETDAEESQRQFEIYCHYDTASDPPLSSDQYQGNALNSEQEHTLNGETTSRPPDPTHLMCEGYRSGLKLGRKKEREKIFSILKAIEIPTDEPLEGHSSWLMRAVEKKSMDGVNLLIELGANVNQLSVRKDSGKIRDLPLCVAARSGYDGILETLLANGAEVNARTEFGNNALLSAAGAGKTSTIRILLEKNAAIDMMSTSETQRGFTSLMRSVHSGHKDAIKLLAAENANPDIYNNRGESLLHIAVQQGRPDIIDLVIEMRTQIGAQDKDGNTAVHLAASKNMTEAARCLIGKMNSILEIRNNKKQTPLHLAIQAKRRKLVDLFLEYQQPLDAEDQDKKTPLHYAVDTKSSEIVRALLKRKPPLGSKDKADKTPLHYAIESKNPDIVEMLLESNPSLGTGDKNKQTPLHHAVILRNLKTIELLLNHWAPLYSADSQGKTPLHHAIESGNKNVVDILLKYRSPINLHDNNGKTALHYAVEHRKPDIVQLLLLNNARPDVKDISGKTTLHYVMEMYKKTESDSIRLLQEFLKFHNKNKPFYPDFPVLSKAVRNAKLGHIAEICRRDPKLINVVPDKSTKFQPALHEAIKLGSSELVNVLCKYSETNRNLRDLSGNTPLHQAVISGQHQLIPLLKADMELPNSKNGLLPLHLATQRQELEVVKELLKQGADPRARISGEECWKCKALPKVVKGMNARCLLVKIPTENRKTGIYKQIDDCLYLAINPHKK